MHFITIVAQTCLKKPLKPLTGKDYSDFIVVHLAPQIYVHFGGVISIKNCSDFLIPNE